MSDDIRCILQGGGRVGVDVGSRSTKVVFSSGDELIYEIEDTPDFLGMIGKMEPDSGSDIVSCGYGRRRVPGSESIPEIRAHATGVIRSSGIEDCTILDIGGQDFKVIRIEGRSIRDFNMNDKCAAGTGRFLEKMASMLSMDISEMGEHRGNIRILESTCSVFTETEIISLMMDGISTDDLASGVIRSVFDRIRPYLRMYPSDTVVFTGGVASMRGLRDTITGELDVEVIVPEKAQYTGAMGCYFSRRRKR